MSRQSRSGKKKKASVGRPASGTTRAKISVSIPINLEKIARAQAGEKNISMSEFISTAIKTHILNS